MIIPDNAVNELKAFGRGSLFGSAMTVLILILWFASVKDWRNKAIEAGAAQYNSQTGEFEWVKR